MPKASLIILASETIGTVSPLLHGHFAEHLGRCCYDGFWVGHDSPIPNEGGLRRDVLQALRDLHVPILRWPGGCFADTYHWRDGIGPLEQRPHTLGESCGLHALEDNHLGTHEFVRLCREIGAEPYLAGNVGSGTPQELMDWVHYCNGTLDTSLVRERASNGHPDSMNVRYWGVGNENWGCGGHYDAVDYAKEFRRFATFIKMVDGTVDLVACGDNKRDWNLKVIETLRNHLFLIDHLSVHQYWAAGHATQFNEGEYYQIMRGADLVEEDIRFTDEILRFFTAGRKKVGIAFDEWGIWHPQARGGCNYEAPSTLRDAVAGAGVLDVFHRWCSRVSMGNIAQIVNVLHCPIQTQGDKMWLTPTYHLFRLYEPHRNGKALRLDLLECPAQEMPAISRTWPETPFPAGSLPLLSASASRQDGELILSLSNRHRDEAMEVAVDLRGFSASGGTLHSLTADSSNALNSIEQPDRVRITESSIDASGSELTLTLPPCSVHTVRLQA